MYKTLHPKIQELKDKASYVTEMSGSYVDSKGILHDIDFKIEANEEDRTIKGYAAVWGSIDMVHREVMIKGCYAKSIADRGPDSSAKQKIAFLWDHKCGEPLGRITKLKEDKYGLYFEAEFDEIQFAMDKLKQVRSGTLNQFSTGVIDIWDAMEYDPKIEAILVKDTKLMEITLCVFGSDSETHVIKSMADYNKKRVELMEATDDFINSCPRDKQLEMRQLITKHITLFESKPPELEKQKVFDLSMPADGEFAVGDYKLNLKEF